MSRMNRRKFVAVTSVGAASLLIGGTRASGDFKGANDRVRVAVAGLNGRGQAHIGGLMGQPNVEIACLIDPDKKALARAVKSVTGKKVTGKADGLHKPKGVSDVRRALEDSSIDAVSIATPNHWHSLMTIWAAQAGKHVYVEKPMSHDCSEGRVVVEAQKKYGVVIQHGTQQRSDKNIADLHKAIHDGQFGPLAISYGYCCKPRRGIGFKPVSDPPSNLDWNLWRGPAMVDKFHANLVHYNWHWFWKTGNGDMNNQGTHQLDRARWALNTDQTHPVRVMALGGRFLWKDQGETPNTMFAIAEYPNGQRVLFNVRNVHYKGYKRQVENEYYFKDGGRIAGGKYYAKGSKEGQKYSVPDGKVTPGGNWGSFIAAVRAGDPSMANGNALEAHYGCVLGHLMNNSYRLGQRVPFNKKAGGFADHSDASEHFMQLHEIMSGGVGLPEDGNEYVVGPWLTYDAKNECNIGEHADAANVLHKDKNRKGFEVPSVKNV